MSDEVPPAFEKLTTNYGPVANLYKIDDRIRLLWQLPIRYLNDALTPARKSREEPDQEIDVTVGFVSNGEFNAAIRHESESVASCVFVGVPLLALKACRQMATRLDAASGLPMCDDGDRLVVFDEPLEIQGTWKIPSGDLAENVLRELWSEDEVIPSHNVELATFMFDIAMRYVAMIAQTAGTDSKPEIDLAFALSIATLERNFSGGVRYAEEIERDLRLHRLTNASAIDRSHTVVRAKATEIQHEVFRNYGAFYPRA